MAEMVDPMDVEDERYVILHLQLVLKLSSAF